MPDRIRPGRSSEPVITSCSIYHREAGSRIVPRRTERSHLGACPIRDGEGTVLSDAIDPHRRCRETIIKPAELSTRCRSGLRRCDGGPGR